MGVTAGVVSSSSGVSAVTSLQLSTEAGVGGIVGIAVLILLVATLIIIDSLEPKYPQLRSILIATITPLLLAFGVIILFESLLFSG